MGQMNFSSIIVMNVMSSCNKLHTCCNWLLSPLNMQITIFNVSYIHPFNFSVARNTKILFNIVSRSKLCYTFVAIPFANWSAFSNNKLSYPVLHLLFGAFKINLLTFFLAVNLQKCRIFYHLSEYFSGKNKL